MPTARQYDPVPESPQSPRPPEEFDLDLDSDELDTEGQRRPAWQSPSRSRWAFLNPKNSSFGGLSAASSKVRIAAIVASAVLALLLLFAIFRGVILSKTKKDDKKSETNWDDYKLDLLPVLPDFPIAPFEGANANATTTAKPWLAAIMISAKDVQRRALVRSTWLRMYRDVPFDYVFVLGNPVFESTHEEGWVELVQAENRTYGDLVVVDRVYEGAHHANSYKSVEFFRWLARRPWMNRYAWVSKVDGDSFVDAKTFFSKYIEPRIISVDDETNADPTTDINKGKNDELITKEDAKKLGMSHLPASGVTFIARYVRGWGWEWPGGQFYTMSRDLIALLPKLQDLGHNPHPNPGEDIRNAMILKSHGFDYDLVRLPNEEAFDFIDDDARDDGSGWAKSNRLQKEWNHAVGRRAINPHKMKTDQQWMRVAACYDENGLKEPPEGL